MKAQSRRQASEEMKGFVKYLFKERGVAQLSFAMVTILALFSLTMSLSSGLAKKQLSKESVEQYKSDASFLKSVSSMQCLASSWIASSFLSGMTDVEILHPAEADEAPRHTMTASQIAVLDTSLLYEKIESYLSYNYDVSSACFIFEPGVLDDAPDGFAAAKFIDEAKRYNLAAEYDIFDSDIYRQTASSRRIMARTGRMRPDCGDQIMFCIPIYDTESTLIAEFWTGTDINKYFAYVKQYQKEGDDYNFAIIDKDCKVIYFPGYDLYGKSVAQALSKLYHNYPENSTELISAAVAEGGMQSFESEYSGKTLMTCVSPIRNSELYLVKVYKGSTIMQTANRTIKSILLLSIVCLVLVLLQLTYIFVKYLRQSREHQRVEAELDVARRIQRRMLPDNGAMEFPDGIDVFGFQRSAHVIGGDLFDYTVKGGKLYFCIGDVSGDGAPAALLMAQICSLLRHIVKADDDASSILTALNDSTLDEDEDRMICTMFAGILDPATGELRFCNAGHCRPVIISGGCATLLEMKANMPIYAFDSYPYTEERIQLRRGDRIFLYTDGVTEARNSSKEMFGSEALICALSGRNAQPASALIEEVTDKVDAFQKDCEQHDDITALCISYD